MTTRTTTTRITAARRAVIGHQTPEAGTSNPTQRESSLLGLTPSANSKGGNDPDGGDGGNGDGGDDGTPDNDPPNNNDPPDNNDADPEQKELDRLLQLIEAFRQPATPKQKAKLREPDAFDGTDSRKLRTFIALCQLNFRSLSNAFPNDTAKVNYAMSYLKGTALEWFEPSITDGDEELWMHDWDEFIFQLQSNFGPADPVGDAEEGLDALRMRDGQKIAKYNVEFNRLAAIAKWGDAPLRHAYYKGLPDRIKDSLVHAKKPTNLQEL
jgi:Retrotransposon gag protein